MRTEAVGVWSENRTYAVFDQSQRLSDRAKSRESAARPRLGLLFRVIRWPQDSGQLIITSLKARHDEPARIQADPVWAAFSMKTQDLAKR